MVPDRSQRDLMRMERSLKYLDLPGNKQVAGEGDVSTDQGEFVLGTFC